MLSRITFNIAKRSIYHKACTLCCTQYYLQSNFLACNSNTKEHGVQKGHCSLHIAKRYKSSRKRPEKKEDIDEESDDEGKNDDEVPAGSKVITVNVQSLRLDAISKAGFGTSRSKIEEAFYASKIRVNGKKVFKKSVELDEGDEIDIILHRSVDNPTFLVINRIMLLSINPATNDSIRIKISRDRNLLIEDYEEPWSSE